MNKSLIGRLKRAWSHATSTSATGRKAFPEASLQAISAAIAEGERAHRAEVRLIVEAGLDIGVAFRGTGMRQRALGLFAEYGVWDTEENCGVLIYINLAEHQVEIVADRHVGRRIAPAEWQALCHAMTQGFAAGAYHDSTLAALHSLNALLARHYPANQPRPNQLPDDAIML